jgi:protein-S-isoprenylcysteine O-methyltransferase Ste14
MLLLLKNVLFTILVPGMVAVYVPLRIIARPASGLTFEWRPYQIVALLPLTLGGAIYFWCLWDFAVSGRGTPAPIDAPKRLVVRGLYRYVRNPMYVGVLLVVAGWAMYLRSTAVLIYGGFLWIAFQLFVVLVEEPSLEKKFGQNYQDYRRTVHRWLPRGTGRRTE